MPESLPFGFDKETGGLSENNVITRKDLLKQARQRMKHEYALNSYLGGDNFGMRGIDEDITSLLSYASSRGGGKKLIYQRGMHKQDKLQRNRYKTQSVDYMSNNVPEGKADELKKYLNQKNISRFNEDTSTRNNQQTKSQCQ